MGGGVARDRSDGAIYKGAVVHRRALPRRHSLRYSVFTILFDLDQIDELAGRLRLFSANRWNLFSLRFGDFGARDGENPAAFARARAKKAGIGDMVARVRMLAYPRILGYAFNPLTVYYLEDADGRTVMLIYEVRNTFGEHHFYEYVVKGSPQTIGHSEPKAFYVSPFNTLDGTYRFSMRPPEDEVFTAITLSTDEGGILSAWFEGRRSALDDAALFKLALAYPLMTVKIIAGIHFEAIKLWLKGVPHTLRLRRHLHKGEAREPELPGDGARRRLYE